MKTIRKQQAKITKLKDSLKLVKHEKDTLAKELEKVKSKLKEANEDLIKFKGFEHKLNQVKYENSSLTTEVKKLRTSIKETDLKFTQGDDKLVKLLKMSKSQGDKAGLGYDVYNSNGPSTSVVVVKGESSSSSAQSSKSNIICHYCGLRGHLKFGCKLSKNLKSSPFNKLDKGKSILIEGKTYKPQERLQNVQTS